MDYRQYLSDYYLLKKLTQQGFSHRFFLDRAGINIDGQGYKWFGRGGEISHLDKQDPDNKWIAYNSANSTILRDSILVLKEGVNGTLWGDLVRHKSVRDDYIWSRREIIQ